MAKPELRDKIGPLPASVYEGDYTSLGKDRIRDAYSPEYHARMKAWFDDLKRRREARKQEKK